MKKSVLDYNLYKNSLDRKRYLLSFTLSISFHLIIVFCFIFFTFNLNKTHKTKPTITQHTEKQGSLNSTIKAYVYQYRKEDVNIKNIKGEKKGRQDKKTVKTKTQNQKDIKVKDLNLKLLKKGAVNSNLPQKTSNTSSSTILQKTMITQGKKNKLLQHLHNLIAKNQRYPQDASILNQHGSTEIQFTLHPNGYINHIKIIKSSGYDLLDTAAIDAVKSINPINFAMKYSDHPELFVIFIVF